MPTSIAKILVGGKDLVTSAVTTAWAGQPVEAFDAQGNRIKKLGAMYLFPHKKPPEPPMESALKDGKFPARLPVGKYDFAANKQGEADKFRRTINVTEAGTPPTDEQPNTPDQPTGEWRSGFGACVDYATLDKLAKPYKAIGLTHVRAFCPGIWTDGKYITDHIPYAKRAIDAGLTFVGLHAMRESDTVIPSTGDRKRYFENHAKAVAGFGKKYVTELHNEVNADKYLDFGQEGGKLSQKAVDYCLAEARIARDALGKDAIIVGPSVGWNASIGIHLDYAKAFADGGMLDLIDVYNDHAYPDGGTAMLADQLGKLREIIGDKRPLWLTETADKKSATSGKPQNVAGFADVYRKYNAVPFWYRGAPGRDKARWSDPWSLLKADGTPNATVLKGLGLA